MDGRRRLRVLVALGRRWHHKCIVKEGSTLAKPAIKWSLKVPIGFSALLTQWRWGETNWKLMLFDRKCHFRASGHPLSRICVCGLKPWSVRYVCNFITALTMSRSDRDFRGSARIALVSSTNITMMYLLPLLDVIGNFPV